MTSIQLFSVLEAIEASGWDSVLGQVKARGFTQVEPFALHLIADEMAPAVAGAGLVMPTAHGFLGPDELADTLDAAERCGISTVFHPHIEESGWEEADAIARTAAFLTAAADRAADRGIRIGFHNHDVGLVHRVDGRAAFWTLLEQLPASVLVEYDIYWAAIAGVDIVQDIQRLGERVTALHIKDGPYRAMAQDQVALGEGALPLRDILGTAANALPVLSLDRFVGSVDEVWAAIDKSVDWLQREHVA